MMIAEDSYEFLRERMGSNMGIIKSLIQDKQQTR